MRVILSAIAVGLILVMSQQQSYAKKPFEPTGALPDECPGCDSYGYASCDCESPTCGECCSAECCTACCSAPTWQFFGDFLYMRPRDAEVVYGVPFNGPETSPPDVPIQVGRTGIVDPGYEPAFRVGFARALNRYASLGATYTYFDGATSDQISTSSPYVIRSMVSHPSTLSASGDGLDASAVYGVDFDLADFDYRGLIACDSHHSLNYLVGARYARLDQGFAAQFAVNGVETVQTEVHFDGGGIRVGLEGERHAANSGLMVYGRGMASFVAGEFRGWYHQGNTYDPTVAETSWKTGRIVTILDLELGIGWTSASGRWHFSGGYLISAWMNTVKTDDFIRGVQSNNFVGLGDTLTFDGLTARAEVRY